VKRYQVYLILLLLMGASVNGQSSENRNDQAVASPFYRLTVVGCTIQTVNYGQLSGPIKIDLQGTVLQPKAHGEATVESKHGATVFDAKIEELPPLTKFGLQCLTYVLWAITPDGKAVNLGKIVLDHSDNLKLHVTTDFPAFGLLATAEPYYAVSQPSDVAVMETVVFPDTAGKIEAVEAKCESLSRGGYTPVEQPSENQSSGKKLRMNQYNAVLAVYQACNAVQIVRSEGADRNAKETFEKAEQLLPQAEASRAAESHWKQTLTTARETTQAAQDARTITTRRVEAESLGLRSATP
jgi:hypothetical protein